MAAQLLAFAVNMGISFFLAPIIEAQMANTYGFVTLANQFVLYAQIVVSALNTMASRFVTIHIHRGEEQEAREYFSSVFFGNVIMALWGTCRSCMFRQMLCMMYSCCGRLYF